MLGFLFLSVPYHVRLACSNVVRTYIITLLHSKELFGIILTYINLICVYFNLFIRVVEWYNLKKIIQTDI